MTENNANWLWLVRPDLCAGAIPLVYSYRSRDVFQYAAFTDPAGSLGPNGDSCSFGNAAAICSMARRFVTREPLLFKEFQIKESFKLQDEAGGFMPPIRLILLAEFRLQN